MKTTTKLALASVASFSTYMALRPRVGERKASATAALGGLVLGAIIGFTRT